MANWRARRKRYKLRKRFSIKSDSLVKSRILVKMAKFGFIGVILLFIGLFFVLPLLAFNLPTPKKKNRRERFFKKILDRNGKVLYDIFADQRRTPIKIT